MNNKLLLSLVGISQVALAGAATKPNLLIIHTDEHSFRTLSCYQEQLSSQQAFVWGKGVNSTTPNIDRIAREGAICNSYYCSSPVSTPSRASMITGLYPQVTGAPKNGMKIRRDIPTIGTILRDNGYSTSYVGKWHLEGDEGVKYYCCPIKLFRAQVIAVRDFSLAVFMFKSQFQAPLNQKAWRFEDYLARFRLYLTNLVLVFRGMNKGRNSSLVLYVQSLQD